MSSGYSGRKSRGMTLLRHLAVRRGKARKKNPNAIIAITVDQAQEIIEDFKDMKAQRDEAMRLLGLRELPKSLD